MIGILLPMTAFGLMLQRPLSPSIRPLSASSIGPRATVPLRMGFVENKIKELVEEKIKEEVEGLVENKIKERVEGFVENKIKEEVEGFVENKIKEEVEGFVENKIKEGVEGFVENKIKEEVEEKIKEEVKGLVENTIKELVEEKIKELVEGFAEKKIKEELKVLPEKEQIEKILKILDVPEIAKEILEFVDALLAFGREKGFTSPLSSMWEFDADFDLLQSLLCQSKLVRKRAQTWENVTSPSCNTREHIDEAYEWSHEFFPNLRAQICGSNRRTIPYYSAMISHAFGPPRGAGQARAVLIQRFDSTGTRSRIYQTTKRTIFLGWERFCPLDLLTDTH